MIMGMSTFFTKMLNTWLRLSRPLYDSRVWLGPKTSSELVSFLENLIFLNPLPRSGDGGCRFCFSPNINRQNIFIQKN